MKEGNAFEQYHETLKLPPDEVAFAREFPDKIREILAEAGQVSVSHSFLQGSLARGTMVPPLKDGDMVLTLDRVRHGELMSYPDGSDDAMTIIQSELEGPLAAEFPAIRFPARSAHALKLELGPGYPDFDLVPAFEEHEPPGELGNVFIADRKDKQWEWSNPRQLRQTVAQANQACFGKLIYVCRMIKSPLKAHPSLHEFPGLAVEALACDCITGEFTLAEGVLRILEEGAQRIGSGPIPEPTGVQDLAPRLAERGLETPGREWFAEKADEARRARQEADNGNHAAALSWWYRVFGDPFPRPGAAKDASSVDKILQGLTFGSKAAKPTRAAGE